MFSCFRTNKICGSLYLVVTIFWVIWKKLPGGSTRLCHFVFSETRGWWWLIVCRVSLLRWAQVQPRLLQPFEKRWPLNLGHSYKYWDAKYHQTKEPRQLLGWVSSLLSQKKKRREVTDREKEAEERKLLCLGFDNQPTKLLKLSSGDLGRVE